jgi:hypothetical protein
MPQLSLVTISVSPPYPDTGVVPVIIRMTGRDKVKIDMAARRLGLSKSQLMRSLLIRGSDRILSELGVTQEYEPT